MRNNGGCLAAQTFTTLFTFDGTHGSLPAGALIQATNGDLYGTTDMGGLAAYCTGSGCGTVFETTPGGALTSLYSFCSQPNCTDGAFPWAAGLVQATNGALYGTTEEGGIMNGGCMGTGGEGAGCGTVFKITPNGKLTTVYAFCAQSGCPDGTTPDAALI